MDNHLAVHHGTQLQCLNLEREAKINMVIKHILTCRPCVCVVDNFMYTFGGSVGITDGPATAQCFRFDPRADSWSERAVMSEARKDFVAVAIDSRLYAIGGRNANAVALNSVEQFDINTNSWVMRSGLAEARYCHAGALCSGRIYISGGKKAGGCSNELLSYNPGTDVWENQPPMLNARCNHSMVEVNGRLYVIGGNVEDANGLPVPVTSIEMFDPMTRVWNLCRTTLSIYGASAAVLNDNVYIVGGITGRDDIGDVYSNMAVQYRIGNGQVQKINETIIHPLNSATASCILQMPQTFPSE